MNGAPKRVEEQALKLRDTDKARLIDRLLASLDQPDSAIDILWEKEAEARITAHRAGQIKSVTLAEVLEKYRHPSELHFQHQNTTY